MVRREIKNFDLVYGEESFVCAIPFSVGSVLSAAGIEKAEGTVRFESDIFVDEAALAVRNFYLRIKGVNVAADVYIGDKLIGRTDGVTPVYNLDVWGIMTKGNNTLSIRPVDSADRILNGGIVGSVEMLRFPSAIIDSVSLSQKHDDGGVIIDVNVALLGNPDSVRAVATLVSSSGQIYYSGLTGGRGSIVVRDPLLWWPRGLGVQNLYRLTVSLYGESDIEDSVDTRLGLRTASAGEGGNIIINGVSVLPMGAVYIPDENADSASSAAKASGAVSAAAMSDYNCLVIPEYAPTPCAKFYELCDVYGIMIIEEHKALDGKTISALGYRANHPSLCLIDLIGEGDRAGEIRAVTTAVPDLAVKALAIAPSYIAAPALPSIKTIRAVVPEDERGLFSHSIEAIAEEGAIREMLLSVADRYPYPRDLSDFAYASALASAHKVGDAIRESRLSLGNSGRAIFYRLNDGDVSISASAVDCRGRWKPLQYYASRHFAPVALYATASDGRVSFSASSQRRIDLIGTLEYRIADSENNTVYTNSVECEIGSMTSALIHTADVGEYLSGHEREYYLEYFLKEGSFTVGKKTMLFVPEKHFCFKTPKLKSTVTGQGRRFTLTVSSDVFVKDMEIDFDGVDVVFDNNYFDITSDSPVRIGFTVTGGSETAHHLNELLQLRCVADLK